MLQLLDYQLLLNKKPLMVFKNLLINGGDVITLMGRSGLGKTSFLLDIAGLLEGNMWHSRGQMILDGIDVRKQPSYLRRVGYFSQRPVVFPFLSVRENFLLALRQKHNKKLCEEKIKWGLQQCQLAGFANRVPKTLSGGEVARLSLMMLVLAEPKLLLLDEPFSSLNKNLRSTMKRFILKLIDQQNIPIIMVTHQSEDALGKVIMLKD
ncbi:MAG: ATP-binding cassette domain-containing protein [Alphaproteobacteria bacterium]